MCYSAKILADYRQYVRLYGADIDLDEFTRIYWTRATAGDVKIPKALDAAFLAADKGNVRDIPAAIARFNERRQAELEADLFARRARQAAAQRKLQEKDTKTANNELRIATDKVAADLRAIGDLGRTELVDGDARIFPAWYAPVLIQHDGQRRIVPMRYRCRLPGWTEQDERAKPGTYNARVDSLRTAWRRVFGVSHGLLLVDSFFENVRRDGRNVVLRFDPAPAQTMLIACLWTRTPMPDGDDLWSFAAITDEPPPEVAAAGHDRCIVPIKPSNIDEWLNPAESTRDRLLEILADREHPYFAHQLAA